MPGLGEVGLIQRNAWETSMVIVIDAVREGYLECLRLIEESMQTNEAERKKIKHVLSVDANLVAVSTRPPDNCPIIRQGL